MSKFWALTITLYGLLILMAIAGLPLSAEDIIANLSPSGMYIIAGALIALCLTGTTISLISKTSPDLWIAATFVSLNVLLFYMGFGTFITYAELNLSNWVYQFIRIIFLILGVTYLALAIDWMMNRGAN